MKIDLGKIFMIIGLSMLLFGLLVYPVHSHMQQNETGKEICQQKNMNFLDSINGEVRCFDNERQIYTFANGEITT